MLSKNENVPYVEEKNRTFGYKIGMIIATVIALCLASVVVALTAKFVMWILGL